MAKALFWGEVSLGCFALVFEQRYHVDRHGGLTMKQLRLSVLNEMHTINSYTGLRLIWKAIFKQFNFTINHGSSGKMKSVIYVDRQRREAKVETTYSVIIRK